MVAAEVVDSSVSVSDTSLPFGAKARRGGGGRDGGGRGRFVMECADNANGKCEGFVIVGYLQ